MGDCDGMNSFSSITDTPFSLMGLFANLIGIMVYLMVMAIAPAELTRPFLGFLSRTGKWGDITRPTPTLLVETATSQVKDPVKDAPQEQPPRDPPRRDRYEVIKV